MPDRVVLAYSGGLDTSVAVRWLIENEGVEVVAVAVDVGQSADRGGEDWDAVRTPSARDRPSSLPPPWKTRAPSRISATARSSARSYSSRRVSMAPV